MAYGRRVICNMAPNSGMSNEWNSHSMYVGTATHQKKSLKLSFLLNLKIGRVLRYATITALTFLVILFIRMLFLPNSMAYFLKFITPSMEAVRSPDAWLVSPVLGALTLGTGWGSIMTLASYNQFKADAEKYSIAIPCIMSLIVVFSGILVHFVGEYLKG